MSAAPQVELVVPVRDEERSLEPNIRRLIEYLRSSFPFRTRVTIADNNSTDSTLEIASKLEVEFEEVRVVHVSLPGRGLALHTIWSQSDADILAYMDVDLSTDLNALLPLVAPIFSGHSDVAIGNRLAHGSRVIRGAKREIISRGYNLLLRATLGTGFSDAQCGFKAICRQQAQHLLPLVQDTSWFFDTELLVLAERAGLRIYEVPVDWIDDIDSRVDILPTILDDLHGIVRIRFGLARGAIRVPQLRAPSFGFLDLNGFFRRIPQFAAVGIRSALLYMVLFLAFRSIVAVRPADATSLAIAAISNTAANQRVIFGFYAYANARIFYLSSLIGCIISVATSSLALSSAHLLVSSPACGTDAAVLTVVNVVAVALRLGWFRLFA
jgi:glycosyltransferase involved in cell wall biosynthesis/putative flippase GtrA